MIEATYYKNWQLIQLTMISFILTVKKLKSQHNINII